MQHDTSESICVNLYDKFSAFLLDTEGAPDTLEELKKKALIKLVITGAEDPDRVGFRRFRTGFYVLGDEAALKNLLYLLDDFWKHAHKEKDKYTTISLHPHYGIDIDCRATH